MIHTVYLRVPASRLAAALMDAERPWCLPGLPLGRAERTGENSARLSAGGSEALISWMDADGGRCCRMAVRHEPKTTVFRGQTPDASWGEAWALLSVRLKSFLEGVALIDVPELGAPQDTEVTLTAHFDAPPERIWSALTDPGELDAWIADGAQVDLSPGGVYDYNWTHDGPAHVLRIDAPRTLETDWRFGAVAAEGRVTWTVGPEDGGARITLVHHGFGFKRSDWPREGYVWGWADFLQALALYLAGAGPSDSWRGAAAAI